MSELTCDNYMLKLIDIETACNNVATTTAQLQTLLTELQTLDAQLELELGDNANYPTNTLSQLRKQILVEIERERKNSLHDSLLNFIEIKKEEIINYNSLDVFQLSTEFKMINEIINSTIKSCNCMGRRENIILKTINNKDNKK